MGNDDVKRNIS